jgi:hypothetical protein
MFDPARQPDEKFAEWFRAIQDRSEIADALREADQGAVEILAKVNPRHWDLIVKWLHNEAVGRVARIPVRDRRGSSHLARLGDDVAQNPSLSVMAQEA